MRPGHVCTPPEAVSTEQDDWCCPGCSQWWRVDEDYCYECGRTGPLEWRKTSARLQGPLLEDEELYRHAPPPFDLWELLDVSMPRGGIFFGEPAPPPPVPTWLERDEQIKARYAKRLEQLAVTEVGEDEGGVVMAGGWCAPSETIYDLGQS